MMNLALKKDIEPGNGLTYSSPHDHLVKKAIINGIEILTGRGIIQKLYRKIEQENPKSPHLWSRVMEELNLKLKYSEAQLNKIPKTGPLVVIANHPYGVVDGLILAYLISRIRNDFSLIVNEVLTREKLISDYLLPIDFRETKEAMTININTRKAALERVKNGNVVAIFPSGAVATTPKVFTTKAVDLEWKRFVIKIMAQSKATILPIFFHGQNSKLFQIASHIHPNLRLGLLMNEVKNKMNSEIKIDIREPLRYDDLPQDLSKDEILEYLKAQTLGSNLHT